MDLMTAVMFLVGLAAGGGGAFFFAKKKTIIDTPTPPTPVASHDKSQGEFEKLKKEVATLSEKHSKEKSNLENEIKTLKNSEIELKDKLFHLSNSQKQENGQDFSIELADVKSKLEARERELSNLTSNENKLIEQVQELQKQISTSSSGRNDSENQVKNLENELKRIGVSLNEKEALIENLNKKVSDLNAAASNVTTVAPSSSSGVKAIADRRLLVVDDSKVVRNKLSSTLKKAGYQVELAEDGRDALNKLLSDNNFDLVVTDLEMPNLDGHQLITEIHGNATLKEIPVMAITGHEEITVNVVHNEGLVGVHKKPWNDAELLKKIAGLSALKV